MLLPDVAVKVYMFNRYRHFYDLKTFCSTVNNKIEK